MAEQVYDPGTGTYSQGPGAQAAQQRFAHEGDDAKKRAERETSIGQQALPQPGATIPPSGTGMTPGQDSSLAKSAARDEVQKLIVTVREMAESLGRLQERLSQITTP